MYEQPDQDPVVRYYDIAFTEGSEHDVPWYVRNTATYGGPVLDLACGTGRISIELARRSFDVTAIDQSEGMLACLRAKLAKHPGAVADRIDVRQLPMSRFNLSKKYGTIICCDAFFHNLSVEDERACLICVREHLLPGGAFLFNIHNPNPRFLCWASSEEASSFHRRGEYKIPGVSDSLLVEHATSADLDTQIVSTRLRFSRRRHDGVVTEQSESAWQSRYLYRYEALHILELCGLRVLSLVGTYHDGPVTPESQLIFTVGLRNSQTE